MLLSCSEENSFVFFPINTDIKQVLAPHSSSLPGPEHTPLWAVSNGTMGELMTTPWGSHGQV